MADFDGVFANGTEDVVYPEEPDLFLDQEASMVELPSGAGGQLTYRMRAWYAAQTQYVHWDSVGAPDFIGTGSGVPPNDLSNFCVLEVV